MANSIAQVPMAFATRPASSPPDRISRTGAASRLSPDSQAACAFCQESHSLVGGLQVTLPPRRPRRAPTRTRTGRDRPAQRQGLACRKCLCVLLQQYLHLHKPEDRRPPTRKRWRQTTCELKRCSTATSSGVAAGALTNLCQLPQRIRQPALRKQVRCVFSQGGTSSVAHHASPALLLKLSQAAATGKSVHGWCCSPCLAELPHNLCLGCGLAMPDQFLVLRNFHEVCRSCVQRALADQRCVRQLRKEVNRRVADEDFRWPVPSTPAMAVPPSPPPPTQARDLWGPPPDRIPQLREADTEAQTPTRRSLLAPLPDPTGATTLWFPTQTPRVLTFDQPTKRARLHSPAPFHPGGFDTALVA